MYFNAIALTITNVSKVLEEVKWEKLCYILEIFGSKRDELEDFPNTDQCREGAMKFWITTDPLASWRRLVQQLYQWGFIYNDEEVLAIGDKLRHCCAELTGMCIHNTITLHMHVCVLTISRA